jgi:hypothetical protein
VKKLAVILFFASIGLIIYFFIKEQFKGIALSHAENIIVSIAYFGFAIANIIFIVLSKKMKKSESADK